MEQCINCIHARQAADTERRDVVGCHKLMEDAQVYYHSKGQLYEGWFYAARLPGSESSGTVTEGVLQQGLLIDADGWCHEFVEELW